jgi:hypothetical protein
MAGSYRAIGKISRYSGRDRLAVLNKTNSRARMEATSGLLQQSEFDVIEIQRLC